MAIKIGMVNLKGGVGKSTLSYELATILSNQGKKVLVIDMDQQRNLSEYVNYDSSKPSIYNVLHADYSIEESVQNLKYFDFISASSDLSRADREFVEQEDIFLLSDVMEMVNDTYDYIITDNSPSRNVLMTMVYIASDYVIIPTDCDKGRLDGINAVMNDISKLKNGRIKYSNVQILGIILNKFEKTVMHSLALERLEELSEEIEEKPFIATVRKSIAASESKDLMQPLQEYDRFGNISVDCRKFAGYVVERCETGK